MEDFSHREDYNNEKDLRDKVHITFNDEENDAHPVPQSFSLIGSFYLFVVVLRQKDRFIMFIRKRKQE